MGAILMFDTTNRSSFDALSVWLTDLHQLSCPNSVVLLVGNKNDLVDHRQVGASEAESFAKRHNLQYMDTSALTGTNVNETFMYLAEEVVARIKNGVLTLPSMGTASSKKIELKDTKQELTLQIITKYKVSIPKITKGPVLLFEPDPSAFLSILSKKNGGYLLSHCYAVPSA